MGAIGLALGASLAWGVSDFLGGLKSREGSILPVLFVSQALGLVLTVVIVLLSAGALPAAPAIGWALLSGAADLVALWALYRGLSLGAMSVVAPVAACGAVLPVIWGLAMGERPPAVVLAAIVLALAGVVASSHEEDEEGQSKPALTRAVGLGLVAAVGFGVGFVALAEASDADVLWTVFFNRAGSVAAVLAAMAVLRVPVGRGLFSDPTVAAIGVLDVNAIALFGLASLHGMLSVSSALSSLYPLITVVLAAIVLGERIRGAQRAGLAAAVTAAAVIGALGTAEFQGEPSKAKASSSPPPVTAAAPPVRTPFVERLLATRPAATPLVRLEELAPKR